MQKKAYILHVIPVEGSLFWSQVFAVQWGYSSLDCQNFQKGMWAKSSDPGVGKDQLHCGMGYVSM